MNKYNWNEIQIYYDNGHTWREIQNYFGVSYGSIYKAIKKNKFKSRNASEAMILSNIRFPRKLSDETKEKISKSRIRYLQEHPDKVPYILNHYSKKESYPEKYFNKILKKSKLRYERYLQNYLYNLDFAFIDKMIDLEIDGNQHYLDNRIAKSNTRRDNWLKMNGWEIIRVKWSDYQKLNKNDKKKYISNLINYIENLNSHYFDYKISITKTGTKKIEKKYFCDCGKEKSKKAKICINCLKIKYAKTQRPEKQILINDVKELGYKGTGRKYNVSDNAIRKWLKNI